MIVSLAWALCCSARARQTGLFPGHFEDVLIVLHTCTLLMLAPKSAGALGLTTTFGPLPNLKNQVCFSLSVLLIGLSEFSKLLYDTKFSVDV